MSANAEQDVWSTNYSAPHPRHVDGMEVEMRPEAEAGGREGAEQASWWTADVLSFSFVWRNWDEGDQGYPTMTARARPGSDKVI